MDDRVLALLAVLALALSVWGAAVLHRSWVKRRVPPAGRFGLPADGRPIVLGFTAEYCLPCKTQQRPALERVRDKLCASLHVQEIDVISRPEVAQHFGVLTLPTTIVLDRHHRAVAINYGVASTEKLLKQIEPFMHSSAAFLSPL